MAKYKVTFELDKPYNMSTVLAIIDFIEGGHKEYSQAVHNIELEMLYILETFDVWMSDDRFKKYIKNQNHQHVWAGISDVAVKIAGVIDDTILT